MANKLTNSTKNKLLAKKTILCKTEFSKMLGLMFSSKNKIKNKAMIFIFEKEQSISIHMLFVFYPIDVLWLDKKKKIVELKTMQPFTVHYPKGNAKYVVELEAGTIKKTKMKINDRIKFQEQTIH